ncbi:hypothetical protein TCAL_15375 [Tigriopus californicus]|uniref:Uncharacterized protein n=1 Tax=Tigriopus californicus TaxID=6832 RepID=A0A553PKP9_TIGCA|nr:hypothetical protein TCAL_15375 [Tigriopus californicus]
MSPQQQKHQLVHDLLDTQVPHSDIKAFLAAIGRIKRAKEAGLGSERSPGSGGQDKKRDETFINAFQAKVMADTTKSMKKLNYQLQVSKPAIHALLTSILASNRL